MTGRVLVARHAMGRSVIGEALVASDGFSARYDLDRIAGVFSRPAHKLVGQSYVGRILVLDTAKVRDVATYNAPERLAEGMVYVLVNGRLAVDQGKLTGVLAGRGVRRAKP